MSTNNKQERDTTTTTKHRCGAAKRDGEQCKGTCTKDSDVCSFHKGVDPVFPAVELAGCSAQTKTGNPCKNAAQDNGRCGTHNRDPEKPRKASSRIGMRTANNVFTSKYWAGLASKADGSAQHCASRWAAAKKSNSALYKTCVAEADAHNAALVSAE
jgi:hypothetical protein